MIKINIEENTNDLFHNDIHFCFLFAGRSEIGDTYWFLNFTENNNYFELRNRISSYFKSQINKLRELKKKECTNIFYLIFDESECGMQITNLDDNNYSIIFITKLKFTTESIILDEIKYIVRKDEFIKSFLLEIDKLSK